MRKENINESYQYVAMTANVPNSASPVATLTVPAGRVYRVQNGTPLILKLYDASASEIPSSSTVYLGWQAPVGQTLYQAGNSMNYGIFQRIALSDQENIDTQGRRLIQFDDEEIARAQSGAISIITGLPQSYKIMLMVNSTDTVDVQTSSSTAFNFDAIVLTEQEFIAQKTGKSLPVVA